MKQASLGQPRLRDRLREEAGRAILAAAEEVFGEHGLGARMEQVAARAGVAVGTLYNHFRDRDALLGAVHRERREALLAALDAAIAATEGRPLEERLRAFLGVVLAHARAHGRFLAALVEAGEGPASVHPARSLLGDLVARVDAVLASAAARGELRPDPRRLHGLAFASMVRGVMSRAIATNALDDDLVDALLVLFVNGVRA